MSSAECEIDDSTKNIDDLISSIEFMILFQQKEESFNPEDRLKRNNYIKELKDLVQSTFRTQTIDDALYDFISISYILGLLAGKHSDPKKAIEDLERKRTEPARIATSNYRANYEQLVGRWMDIYQSKPGKKNKQSAIAIAKGILNSVKIEWNTIPNGVTKNPVEVTERSVRDTILKIRKRGK